MRWLYDLLASVEAFDGEIKDYQPDSKVGDGEKIIGKVPKGGLRKLLAYCGALIDRITALKEAHEKEHRSPSFTREMCGKFGTSISQLSDELEVLGRAFWRELRDELKTEADCVGVRKGWKVVEIPGKKRPRIEIFGIGVYLFGDFLGHG